VFALERTAVATILVVSDSLRDTEEKMYDLDSRHDMSVRGPQFASAVCSTSKIFMRVDLTR